MNLGTIIDIFIHLDKYLTILMNNYHVWAYVVIILAIFIETGLVVMPFLPGDSLIFVTGSFAAIGQHSQVPLIILGLYLAAILGDTANYHIGKLSAKKVKKREKIAFVKTEYIDKTQKFFEKHGGKTITIARFIPIIRTFAPFIAGVGEMPYKKFLIYNAVGAISWVSIMFGIGYFFGSIPYIKGHFSFVVVGIIIISIIPAIVAFIKSKHEKKA